METFTRTKEYRITVHLFGAKSSPSIAKETVRKVSGDCVKCHRYQAPVVQQLMSDLPDSRVCSGQLPFTSTGVDCFDPFFTKKGRSQVKRYGVIFYLPNSKSCPR